MGSRPGYDPTRRNRNIGTSKQGRGRDNWMGIPWPEERRFYERLEDPVVLTWKIHGRSWGFLIEPAYTDSVHACTPDDVARVIELLPADDLEGLQTVVFRQPTRKQAALEGVWGRWAIAEQLGPHDHKYRWCGFDYRWAHVRCAAVFIESCPVDTCFSWSKKLDPPGAAELERLRQDGHQIVEDKRHYRIQTTPDSCRATQLYRTLPHEIGHHLDYWRRVMRRWDGKTDEQWAALNEGYWRRPQDEHEAFAHRYADGFRERMLRNGDIPFERFFDPSEMADHGVRAEWFAIPE